MCVESQCCLDWQLGGDVGASHLSLSDIYRLENVNNINMLNTRDPGVCYAHELGHYYRQAKSHKKECLEVS